jgi:splicing factor 3A subunit 2
MLLATTTAAPCYSPNQHVTVLVQTTRGRTASARVNLSEPYDTLVNSVWDAAESRDCGHCGVKRPSASTSTTSTSTATGTGTTSNSNVSNKKQRGYLVHQGKILEESNYQQLLLGSHNNTQPATIHLRLRLRGGVDRQNRVGSKFGGGGVSSSQNAERERKDRLKRLALESIDLAKDPYLIRNHLGTYECKLCLTLHTNEANYLAHTQGKKHQQGLGRRAHLETKKAERDAQYMNVQQLPTTLKPKPKRVKIGRPAYQVFKSRDEATNQRCLSFEVTFPQTQQQPRHRFMSAFEQKVDVPANRNYQYLLVAAEPYETIAFKIPNEPIDKGEGRFVTHWNDDDKKFIITLYFVN